MDDKTILEIAHNGIDNDKAILVLCGLMVEQIQLLTKQVKLLDERVESLRVLLFSHCGITFED